MAIKIEIMRPKLFYVDADHGNEICLESLKVLKQACISKPKSHPDVQELNHQLSRISEQVTPSPPFIIHNEIIPVFVFKQPFLCLSFDRKPPAQLEICSNKASSLVSF